MCKWLKWIVDWKWIGMMWHKNTEIFTCSESISVDFKWIGKIFYKKNYNSLILSYNWLLMAAIEFTQST